MLLAELDKKLPLDYELSFQTKECFDLSRLLVFGLNSVYTNYKSLRTSPFWKITFTKKIEDIGYASILKVTKGNATENSHIQRFQEVIPDVDLIVEVCESVKVQFEHFGERFIEEFISTYSGELYSLKYYTDAQVQRGKYLASQLLLELSSIILEEGVMDTFLSTLVNRLGDMMDASICSMTIVKWCTENDTFEMPAVYEQGKMSLGQDKFPLVALKSRPIYRVILNKKPFIMSKDENRRLISTVNIHGLQEAATAILPMDLGDKNGAISISTNVAESFSCWDLALISSSAAAMATIYRQNIMQSKIYQQANYDQLTGIANRAHFKRHLASMDMKDGEKASLLYIDLDKFKQVNDNYGHDVGDKYLKYVAKRIVAQLRDTDLPARIGGDEFAVVVNNINSPDDSLRVAQRIVNAFTSPIDIDGLDHDAGVSIGIYDFDNTHDISLVILKADKAMYLAKSAGRGRFIKYEENG